MIILKSIEELISQTTCLQCALAMGVFDGVHRGHQKVIEPTLNHVKTHGGCAGVLTFDPHPISVMAPERAPARILASKEHKRELLAQLGIELVLEIEFTPSFAVLAAEEFVRMLLGGSSPVSFLSVGSDWRFGADRKGDVALLQSLGAQYETKVCSVAPVLFNKERISSTRIRSAIQEGNLQEAKVLLGRWYAVFGEVVQGRQLGRTWGTPTANIEVGSELLPPSGVYCVEVWYQGRKLRGVANLGKKPTVSKGVHARKRSLEVHLLDFSESIYGEFLEVAFLSRIRAEEEFPSLDALKLQIQEDIYQAQLFFKGWES